MEAEKKNGLDILSDITDKMIALSNANDHDDIPDGCLLGIRDDDSREAAIHVAAIASSILYNSILQVMGRPAVLGDLEYLSDASRAITYIGCALGVREAIELKNEVEGK